MRAARYPSCRRPNGKAVNLQPSVPFPTCVSLTNTHPPKRNYMEEPAKWEESGLAGTSWLVSERKSDETKNARCCIATILNSSFFFICHTIPQQSDFVHVCQNIVASTTHCLHSLGLTAETFNLLTLVISAGTMFPPISH